MKAQLEALNARIAKLEAAPAVPTGFSLLTLSEGEAAVIPGLEEQDASYGTKAHTIGILPTADMPATAELTWTGFVRAAIVYDNWSPNVSGRGGDDDINVRTRGEIKVTAKTATAVGDVGVMMKLRANTSVFGNDRDGGNPGVESPEYWGYWAMTPEWTLGGGYSGTLANIGFGYDGACTCYYTDNSNAADFNPGDVAQMRLSYVSGPLSFALAVEDGSVGDLNDNTDDSMGISGELKYSGDTVSGEISGGYWSPDDFDTAAGDFDGVKFQVGAGLGFALGDMANLSIAGAYGGYFGGSHYWGVSGLLTADLSETISAELGAAYKNVNNGDAPDGTDPLFPTNYTYADNWSVLAGLYWKPVDQLKIGVEAEYLKAKNSSDYKSRTTVDLVTVYSF
jgi:hypothetical protein